MQRNTILLNNFFSLKYQTVIRKLYKSIWQVLFLLRFYIVSNNKLL